MPPSKKTQRSLDQTKYVYTISQFNNVTNINLSGSHRPLVSQAQVVDALGAKRRKTLPRAATLAGAAEKA
jgi:hypothetical protein